jgi:S-DNA-T family DNA segregation ATPase FtsK/SpoIIIE
MLVAGTTGGGKSNFLNVMLCSLLIRNTPEMLKIILIDMKGGMEMGFYEDIPHLYPIIDIFEGLEDETYDLENGLFGGIVTDRELVPPVLAWLMKECNHRMAILREAGYKDIDKYNGKRKRKLPRILLLIDELAQIRLIRKIGADVDELLSSIAAIGRAVGIHLVIATQMPKREVISSLIKANLPAKIATNCANNVQSELILDNGNASQLNVPGRVVYQCGEELLIQTPYISDGTIREIVQSIKDGRVLEFQSHDVTLEEILIWALDNLEGKLLIKTLYLRFKDRGIARDELNTWLKQIDNQTIDLRGSNYKIIPGAGTKPRRIEFVVPDTATETNE